MIRLYTESKSGKLTISRDNPLPATEFQALDIFNSLQSYENVILGLFNENNTEVKISPLNKFLWKISVQSSDKKIKKNIYYSKERSQKLISEIFKGKNPLEIETK